MIYENFILRNLSARDLEALVKYLDPIDLPRGFQLANYGEPISYVCFPEIGVSSTVAKTPQDREIELGIIGREGVIGVPVLLGNFSSPHATYMQLPGHGHRIASDRFPAAMEESRSLKAILLRFVHSFLIQVGGTAVANGTAVLEARLARWLLMVHDRQDGDSFEITHEFLSVMLGVGRPRVTVALQILEGRQAIRSKRGIVMIANRSELERFAGGWYGTAEREFLRVMGSQLSRAAKR